MGKPPAPALLIRLAVPSALGYAALQVVLGVLYDRGAETTPRRSLTVGAVVLLVGLVAAIWVLVADRRGGR